MLESAPVCLIGQTPAEELFHKISPVGRKLDIGGKSLQVTGVLARHGPNSFGWDRDDTLLVPITTFRLLTRDRKADDVDEILVAVKATAANASAKRQIEATLRGQHGLQAKDEDDFAVTEAESSD